MIISSRDAADLEWYLSWGLSAFYRSTTGAMLERASVASRDSKGNKIPIPMGADKWCYMHVHAAQNNDHVEVADETLDRFAKVSRKLLATERKSPEAARALECYFGDDGARWGRTDHGPGRIVALYPYTHAGTIELRNMALEEEKSGTHLDIRPSERLANLANIQARKPTEAMANRIARINAQAIVLFVESQKTWVAAVRELEVAQARVA